MLTCRVMLDAHDMQSRLSAAEDGPRAAEFLSVSTFLKPQFRVSVEPRSGELQVRVELTPSSLRSSRLARH